jgi:hypothetical protein
MADRALVKNAADPQQVKRATRKEQDRERQRIDAIRATMATPAGRFVLYELIEMAGAYRSIYEPNATIYYRAGRQDYGHELMALLIQADEDAYDLMQREARTRAKREAAEIDAAHTPAAEPTNGGQ